MLADYHVHTAFSDDSAYPLEAAARDAVALHLDEICITDHVDYIVRRTKNEQHEGETSLGRALSAR